MKYCSICVITVIITILFALCHWTNAQPNRPSLRKQGTATQLMVEGQPFLILGGELGNSSASSVQDIERHFARLQRMGLNTVLVPAYWDLMEPVEGQFDFTLTDCVIRQARINKLKVVFLWFGAWKNSMSCYAPTWFKQDYKKYPRAHTRSGKPLEIASSFSENVFQADCKAFTQWLKHVAAMDKDEHTVLMVQIENEIGMLEDARDYSLVANRQFSAPVPTKLIKHLSDHKSQLHPQMLAKWQAHGCRTKGNWQEVFGADLYTDELFMAWSYAQYVQRMAQAARPIYSVPLYVNAAMNSRNRKPGEYPSAGPLAHLIDVWQCAAPDIDFLAPDLYDSGFKDWVSRYKLFNNPLFIPEIRLADNNGVRAFYVFGQQDAIGFSPFSIEDGSDQAGSPLPQAYATLRNLMPLITAHQGRGTMNGVLLQADERETILDKGDMRILCRHYFTLPWDSRATDGTLWPEGGGIIIRTAPDEYIISGSGIVLTFEKPNEQSVHKTLGEDGFLLQGKETEPTEQWQGTTRLGLASVDEVSLNEDGTYRYIRRLNGDQDHQGRHVRISVDEFKTLRVKLYEYK